MKSKDLIKMMKKNGWSLKSVKGSHHKFTHSDYDYPVIVPHPKQDLAKGITNQIMKDAGLK